MITKPVGFAADKFYNLTKSGSERSSLFVEDPEDGGRGLSPAAAELLELFAGSQGSVNSRTGRGVQWVESNSTMYLDACIKGPRE